MLPGRYSIKFLARDDETGRIGTYQSEFTIPNLNKETEHVPISSVVLSSQRVDTRDALYTVAKGKEQIKNDAKNPLVQEGLKLIPSVTRVFNTDVRCMCTCRPMRRRFCDYGYGHDPCKAGLAIDCLCEPLPGGEEGIRIAADGRDAAA